MTNPNNNRLPTSERGATLTGYALTVALVVVMGLGSMELLDRTSEEVLRETGDQIGDMRPTLGELRQNPNAVALVTPQNPPPGPPADIANPPIPQATPPGYSFQNVNYQAGYASPILDLVPDPNINPYQDDNVAFVFSEGGGVPPAGFVVPNATAAVPGPEVCSLYLRYSARSSSATSGPIQVETPGEILGFAATNGQLDNTDTWLGGQDPAGDIFFRNSRAFESSEINSIAVVGSTMSIPQLRAVNTNTDELRIFYNC